MIVKHIENLSKIKFEENYDVTIGFFDGVHKGHDYLINIMINSSENKKMIITFDEHPFKKKLIDIDEKINILSSYQVDLILVINMNEEIKTNSKEEFIKFLKNINTKKIYVGNDFCFGNKASGRIEDLKKNFDVNVIEFLTKKDKKVSSTAIRYFLEQGEIKEVNTLLNRNYKIHGKVIHGDQIGRTIDFPTANIQTEYFVPMSGIYCTITKINDKIYKSLTNIGTRPTINDNNFTIETHILDFELDIYGEEIEVEFLEKIRSEKKFENLSELKKQIKKDEQIRRTYDD